MRKELCWGPHRLKKKKETWSRKNEWWHHKIAKSFLFHLCWTIILKVKAFSKNFGIKCFKNNKKLETQFEWASQEINRKIKNKKIWIKTFAKMTLWICYLKIEIKMKLRSTWWMIWPAKEISRRSQHKMQSPLLVFSSESCDVKLLKT